MKKIVLGLFFVLCVGNSHASESNKRISLLKRSSVTTLNVLTNAAMGAIQLQKVLSYLIEDERKSYIAAASIAAIIALAHESVQLRQLNKDCTGTGDCSHTDSSSWVHYDFGIEKAYYQRKIERVTAGLVWGSIVGAATGGIVSLFKINILKGLVSGSRTASNIYWLMRLISAMSIKINF